MVTKYELVRYDTDADREPIYTTRLLVAKFVNQGTANHVANTLQREAPGVSRGMFRVEVPAGTHPAQGKLYRAVYSAR